jgi:hypothetical protein
MPGGRNIAARVSRARSCRSGSRLIPFDILVRTSGGRSVHLKIAATLFEPSSGPSRRNLQGSRLSARLEQSTEKICKTTLIDGETLED